jgi:branched-chain amino acid transport system ATP-binding protein
MHAMTEIHRRREAVSSVPQPLIVKDVSKAYGGVTALQEVSFELFRDEILGIVGPNGAGKTTLIDVLTGIQRGDSGEVLLEGRRLEGGASERALAGLSRTFQHPQLSGELTVGENVGLGLLRLQAPRSWTGMALQMLGSMLPPFRSERGLNDQIAVETGRKIGLENLGAEMASTSFGTEKLAEVGRALISRPSVLLMDEPFAGLGKAEIDCILDAVERWRQNALGMIIVDHNIDLLSAICDRLLVLDSGIVIACGPPGEVFSNPEVQKAYFGGE